MASSTFNLTVSDRLRPLSWGFGEVHATMNPRINWIPSSVLLLSASPHLSNGLKYLGTTADKQPVYDRPNSHHHLSAELLDEVLRKIAPGKTPFVKLRVKFDRDVGMNECVRTTPADTIIWARRVGRAGPTRFVKDRKPEPCSSVIVILKQRGDAPGFLLVTAFVGVWTEPEVWDRAATPAAEAFWREHALVWGSCPVVADEERSG